MSFGVRILADSVNTAGCRLVTFECTYERFIHSEIMTHRRFCLDGDSVLDFDLPSGTTSKTKRIYKLPISEFVDKWHNGTKPHKTSRYKHSAVLDIPDDFAFSAHHIAELLNVSYSNLNAACAKGLVAGSYKATGAWFASGKAWKDWRTTKGVRRCDLQSRLSRMQLRQLDEVTHEVTTTNVVDCCYSGDKEVFCVTFANGYSVSGSKDHLLLTDSGWLRIEDLTVGVHSGCTYRYGTTNSNPYKHKKVSGKWVSRWNNQNRHKVAERQNGLCHVSGLPLLPSFHLHHKNPVHLFPEQAFDIENVVAVNPKEHLSLHKKQGWQTGCPLTSTFSPVTSIVSKGIKPTYDLSVSGKYANFFADGVVVHNSRNAASSRAIPIEKMLQRVMEDPVVPIHWGKNQKGMQAFEELGPADREYCETLWLEARDMAVEQVEQMSDTGLHKQIANRLLEPFMWITTIISTTDFEHFRSLRCHKDAEPHFQRLAYAMSDAYEESIPKELNTFQWHLPLTGFEGDELLSTDELVKVSCARCARVSYLTHDGRRDVEADLALHDRLAESRHWSPFEHAAMAMEGTGQYANFNGFKQARLLFAHQHVPQPLYQGMIQ